MTKKKALSQCSVGRFVRVRYDDIGVVDGLCARNRRDRIVERYLYENSLTFKVYEHNTHTTDVVNYDQIVAVGPYLNIPAF